MYCRRGALIAETPSVGVRPHAARYTALPYAAIACSSLKWIFASPYPPIRVPTTTWSKSGVRWLEETLANRRWGYTADRRFVILYTQRVSVAQRLQDCSSLVDATVGRVARSPAALAKVIPPDPSGEPDGCGSSSSTASKGCNPLRARRIGIVLILRHPS